MVEDKEIVFNKDEKDNICISLSSFKTQEVQIALDGINFYYHSGYFIELPYYCLRFLSPRDTSYYMRYMWIMGNNGLTTLDKELTREETLEFFTKVVSVGLDEDTKIYLSKYTRITNSSILGPLISHILFYHPGPRLDSNDLSLLSLLLADKTICLS